MTLIVKIEKNRIKRLNNYINSEYYKCEDSNLTTHWKKRVNNFYNQIILNDDHILINKFKNGVDENYLDYFKPNFILNLNKFSLKKILVHGLSPFLKKNSPLERLKREIRKENYKKIVLPDSKNLNRQQALAYLFFNDIINVDQINNLKKINYLEIGPGAGHLTLLFLKHMEVNKINLIDLPEIIPLTFIYISYMFPNISISLPNEKNLKETSLISFETPNTIDNIETFNLMVNTQSFAEMNLSNIKNYFNFLRSKCEDQNIFYCYNRVEKYMRNQIKPDGQINPIRFTEYNWSDKDEVFLYKLDDFNHIYSALPFFKKIVKLHIDINF